MSAFEIKIEDGPLINLIHDTAKKKREKKAVPVSVLDSFFSTGRGLTSNMSAEWEAPPPRPHSCKHGAGQKTGTAMALASHPPPALMGGALTHAHTLTYEREREREEKVVNSHVYEPK